jgi:antitoxin component of RelBE/YafQ-DinJ toxin-antitoxin module
MPRLNESGDSSKGQTQLSVRVNEELKEAFKEAADSNGETMTDAVETLLRNYVDDSGGSVGDDHLPSNTTLAAAYRALRQRTSPDSNVLGVDVAKTVAASSTNVPSSGVRREVLDPLQKRGYISVQWGRVVVAEPSEVEL